MDLSSVGERAFCDAHRLVPEREFGGHTLLETRNQASLTSAVVRFARSGLSALFDGRICRSLAGG